MNDRLYQRLPQVDTVTLALFVTMFIMMPMLFAWKGFVYMFGTIIFSIATRPHVVKLAETGHRVNFAIRIFWPTIVNHPAQMRPLIRADGMPSFIWHFLRLKVRGLRLTSRRFEWSYCWRVNSLNKSNKLVGYSIFALAATSVPLLAFIMQLQGMAFWEQIGIHREALLEATNRGLDFTREQVPNMIPSGDIAGVVAGLTSQVVGDLKQLVLKVSGQALLISGVILKDYILICISALINIVIWENWNDERDSMLNFAKGISHDKLRQTVVRYFELYQEGLSTLLIGFLEVAITLTLIYVVFLIVFPFNLSFGAILMISLTLGFITAIWKVGGLIAMIIGAALIIMDFSEGLGWFGYTLISFGILADVIIKTFVILVVAKILGFFEAYNFTPTTIGKKLGLTKMQMVYTILVWALGSNFFGMLGGVLMMMTVQAAIRLGNEKKAEKAATL